MDFELKPRISPSEKDFFLKLGSNWVSEKNEIFSENLYLLNYLITFNRKWLIRQRCRIFECEHYSRNSRFDLEIVYCDRIRNFCNFILSLFPSNSY